MSRLYPAALFLITFFVASPSGADQGVPLGAGNGEAVVAAAAPVVATVGFVAPDRIVIAAPRPRPSLLPALYVSLAGLQSYDAYSTLAARQRGAVEANPLFRGMLGHPVAFVTIKAAATVGSIYVAERLWRQHRRGAAIIMMAVTNGMMASVAAHNAGVVRAQR